MTSASMRLAASIWSLSLFLGGCEVVNSAAAVGQWAEASRANSIRQRELNAIQQQQPVRNGNVNPPQETPLTTYRMDGFWFRDAASVKNTTLYVYPDRIYAKDVYGNWFNIARASIASVHYKDGLGVNNEIIFTLHPDSTWGRGQEICTISLVDGKERHVAPALDRWARGE